MNSAIEVIIPSSTFKEKREGWVKIDVNKSINNPDCEVCWNCVDYGDEYIYYNGDLYVVISIDKHMNYYIRNYSCFSGKDTYKYEEIMNEYYKFCDKVTSPKN